MLIAVVPGAIVHGAGQHTEGHDDTASRLWAAELAGLGLVLGSGVGLAVTGASRYVVAPLTMTTIGGVALFGVSWLADIHATAAPPGGFGEAQRVTALAETEAGYRYVYDPQFRYRHFAVQAVDLRVGRVQVAPSAWLALDDDNYRARLALGYRLLGATPGRPAAHGSSFELEVAGTHHAFDSDGFSASAGEIFAGGRLDLRTWDEHLAGSFADLGFGLALRRTEYQIEGVPADHDTLLLARLGFGFWLGDPADRGGEVELYYDHRHDDFAAGLHLTGLGSGVAGHFGLRTRYWLGESFGISGDAQVGSAWIAGLSILYRHWSP